MLFGDEFETRMALLALTGSALGWTAKLLYEAWANISTRQLEKWEIQFKIYWPLLCKLYNIRILIVESNHYEDKCKLKTNYAIDLIKEVKQYISTTIYEAVPKPRLINMLLELETTIDTGLLHDDAYRFISIDLIDNINIFIKSRLTELSTQIHKNTCTYDNLICKKNEFKPSYYDANHMNLLTSIENESFFKDKKNLPLIITKRQDFILKNEINTKSQELLDNLTHGSCLDVESGLENEENKTRDVNMQTDENNNCCSKSCIDYNV